MAAYSLVSSYSTVQVLSSTLTQNVVYCTIKTNPSGVIASLPIDADFFGQNEGGRELEAFAEAIERVMALGYVIAGVGTQQLDQSNLLGDFVTFTVRYPWPPTAGTSITTEADVPVTLLDFSDPTFGDELWTEVQAITRAAYHSLEVAAGG